ncbi:MAG TPA: hypothetical protein VGN63_11075 [Flavisolibacter sp.]|jgi:hypothetical protein|nr:hypothetical protein [Flavisolibacter sp.]
MKRLYLLLLSVCCGFVVAAQGDGGGADINVDINKGGEGGAGFFANPVVWVVGAAVFILLLVALLRRPRG